jgi:hypothetical protein
MLVFAHFSVPFYSYYFTDRLLKNYKNERELFVYSSVVGFTGIIPDILGIHLTLASRHNSFSHTLLAPLIAFLVSGLLVYFQQIPKRFLLWFPLAVSLHLFLDALSGGIRLFLFGEIIGSNMIESYLWGFFEIFFFSLLIITYKHDMKKSVKKAEYYN